VSIWLATSAANADLVVKLVCVRPNGDADFVSIGIARGGYLFSDSYQPDAAQLWEFELEPSSWAFAAGERLRIEIAGGSFPLYDKNPGTDVSPREASCWNWKRSTHLVYHDAERASAIHLPVVTA
jgi:predicted acyl esterase